MGKNGGERCRGCRFSLVVVRFSKNERRMTRNEKRYHGVGMSEERSKVKRQNQKDVIVSIFVVYTFNIYLYVNDKKMKTLSLKLDNEIFDETEELTSKLKKTRNRYINEALNIYNLFNKRRLLKKQLIKESRAVKDNSMEILSEFEKLIDEEKTI